MYKTIAICSWPGCRRVKLPEGDLCLPCKDAVRDYIRAHGLQLELTGHPNV